MTRVHRHPPVVLLAILATALAVSAPPATAAASQLRTYHSRPDLRPPALRVLTPATGTAPGSLFLAPKRGEGQGGPLIADDRGQTVWFRPVLDGRRATDFRVQRNQGRPVLTWWEGRATGGRGAGHGVIADTSYRIIAKVPAGDGLDADLHEFRLTDRGTALLTIYRTVPRDLRPFGGPKRGNVVDGIVQEVDVATRKVVFSWHALGEVALRESHVPVPHTARPYDFFHLNSVEPLPGGDLLVSSRHTDAVYRISRATGRIAWRLGGTRSDFRLGPGAHFSLQHDARLSPDGTIRIFDNSSAGQRGRSRVISLALDPVAHTATLVRDLGHPSRLLAATQGDAQLQPNGDLLVGWGSRGRISELGPTGALRFDLRLPHGFDTYRAYRDLWDATPPTSPALAADRTTAWASWNGATRVAAWVLLAGGRTGALAPVTTVPRTGFETRLALPGAPRRVAVRAIDAAGTTLGTSRTATIPAAARTSSHELPESP